MATGSGISAQLAMKAEVTYGTAVTPDRWFEFNDESLKLDIARLESAGLRSGKRVQRSDRWAAGRQMVDGSITTELTNKNMGVLFKQMFGGVATSGPVGSAYTHSFTPADLTGIMATYQIGRPDVAGTVQPFTYAGGKVKSWELGAKVNEIGKLKVDINAASETTATALATASYPASLTLMTFVQGTLTIAGSAVSVREAKVKGDNGLSVGRHFLGSATQSEPLEGQLREYTGSLEADFSGLTAYNRFINGTEAALVLLFQGATISGADKYEIKLTCNVRFDGETPKVASADTLPLMLPFKCLDSGAGASSAIQLDYKTSDTTP